MEMKRYTITDVQNSRFYQMPVFLFEGELKKLDNNARVLYTLLRNRHELSLKNGWINENGEVYLIFSRKEMQDMIGVSEKTVTKAMKELTKHGLVEEERQGLRKPNLIYLTAVTLDTSLNRRIYGSRTGEFTVQEPENLRPNYTYLSNTNINNNSNKVLSILKDTTNEKETEKDVVVVENINQKNETKKETETALAKEDISVAKKEIQEAYKELGATDDTIFDILGQNPSADDVERMTAAIEYIKTEYIAKDKKIKNLNGLLRMAFEKKYKNQSVDPVAIKHEKRLAREREEWEKEYSLPVASPEVVQNGLEMMKSALTGGLKRNSD